MKSAELNAIADRVVQDFFKRGNEYVARHLEWAQLAAKAGIARK
jgi:hypothetical protein